MAISSAQRAFRHAGDKNPPIFFAAAARGVRTSAVMAKFGFLLRNFKAAKQEVKAGK